MPNLRVLNLKGNPFIRKVSNYRKNLINSIKTLRHLDETAVSESDRRRAEAFIRGGQPEERKELDWIRKENRDAKLNNHNEFKATAIRLRDEQAAKDGFKHHAGNPFFDVPVGGGENQPEEKEDDDKPHKKESMKELMAKAKKA